MSLKLKDSLHRGLPRVAQRTICWTPNSCAHALAAGQRSIFRAIDIETIPYKKPAGKKSTAATAKPEHCDVFAMTVVSYSFLMPNDTIESFAFPLQRSKSITSGLPEHIDVILETILALNALPTRTTFHNGVYDCAWFIFFGMKVTNYAYDSMTMFWSIWPDLPKRLDFVSSILLDDYKYWKGGRKSDDYTEYMVYAMSDTESTLCNTLVLARYLNEDSAARSNFFHAHLRCLSGLAMSALGLAVDESVMDEMYHDLSIESDAKLARVKYLIGNADFNINSPVQKKFLIYRLFKARMRTAKGKYTNKESDASTGRMALQAIRHDHPLFRLIIDPMLEAITPGKQISNVIKMPRFPAGSSGSRLLTSYDGVGTTTTRYSSRASAFGHGSNVQNIRGKYRRFARADTDSIVVEIDFSAADDAFVGFESAEPKKIELFRSGKDAHAFNACIFFTNHTYDSIVAGKKEDADWVVHPITGVRQITKKLVHGGHYLMAGSTLLASAGREAIVAAAIEIGFEDAGKWDQNKLVSFCDQLDARFRNFYPRFQRESAGVISWYHDLRQEVIATGGFLTWNGYFQRFLSDPYDDSTLRAVAATAGQAGTAGRVNMVLDELLHGYIPKRFRDGDNPHRDARPNRISESDNGITARLQTHDSINFNICYRHRNWQKGLEGVFDSFSRPCVIKGETFNVRWEADAGVYWKDKQGIKFHTIDELEDYISKITSSSSSKLLA